MTEIDKLCNRKDMITDERYKEIIQPLIDLAVNRNEKYGSGIGVLTGLFNSADK
ncbi:MAG: hypothetical protein ABGW68_00235 [Gammaproteobacteria bacterium]|jgi:hypothetical protein